MIIYSVTVIIDEEVEFEWLRWMKEEHIPQVLATGCFKTHQIRKLIDPASEDGITYNIQYELPSWEFYQTYQEQHAQNLQRDHLGKFRDQFAAFRTVLEIV